MQKETNKGRNRIFIDRGVRTKMQWEKHIRRSTDEKRWKGRHVDRRWRMMPRRPTAVRTRRGMPNNRSNSPCGDTMATVTPPRFYKKTFVNIQQSCCKSCWAKGCCKAVAKAVVGKKLLQKADSVIPSRRFISAHDVSFPFHRFDVSLFSLLLPFWWFLTFIFAVLLHSFST